jgi:hypothetical protein
MGPEKVLPIGFRRYSAAPCGPRRKLHIASERARYPLFRPRRRPHVETWYHVIRARLVAEKVSVLGGMKVVTVTPAVRAERNIRSDRGALIYDISAEMEQGTGLRSGDVIVQINRTRIESVDDLRRAFAAAAGGGAVTVWFERDGRLGRTAFYVR